jgi:predicted membrane channel-forming protein YqfA (hemolysin III family)
MPPLTTQPPALAPKIDAIEFLGPTGLAYTAGAVVYARRRPDPLPAVFGYHELFHALTIAAVAHLCLLSVVPSVVARARTNI